MSNLYQIDWDSRKERFEQWWNQQNIHPITIIQAPRVAGAVHLENDKWTQSSAGEHVMGAQAADNAKIDYSNYWLDFDTIMARTQSTFESLYYTGDTYPRMFACLGVASLAVFLGCDPIFAKDTIWYKHFLADPEAAKIAISADNPWLNWSLETTKRALKYANGSFNVGIPDLCEHLDVLASLFDTQELLVNMLDCEEDILRLSSEIQEQWFRVYDLHYDLVKEPDGFSNYGPFQLLGRGKIAKLQCDMSAMIGKDMFDTFVLPFLKEQTEWLNHSVYHLDGPDAVKHLDSVLSLDKLTALQWTPGAGNCDGGDEEWDFIYEKALSAGKSIYALVTPKNVKRFVKRFGGRGVLMMTSAKSQSEADELRDIIAAPL